VCGIAAGEGLARLDGGTLAAGLFLLSKEGLEMKVATMKIRCRKATLAD
jgi:hypothetical protein